MRTLKMLLLLSMLAFLPRTTEAVCLRFPFFPSDLGCRGDTPICVDSSGKRARFRGSRCVRCVNARNLVFRNRDQGCLSGGSPDCVLEDGVSEPAEDKEGAKCVNKDDANVEEECCDQDLEPGFEDNFDCDGEGYACCPDGSWACSIGDGQTFVCGGNEVVDPQGKVCPLFCSKEVMSCPDGSLISRDTLNHCFFPDCPCLDGCPRDVRECPDGSTISRDPCNDCEFPDCVLCCEPEPKMLCLIGDARCCPQGEWSCPNGQDGTFKCGDKLLTPDDTFSEPCACTEELKKCPDGSFVPRDPSLHCAFAPCCCDRATEPGVYGNPYCIEGHACCPDGTWTCGIGDGTFACGDQNLVRGQDKFGGRCECKDACTDDVKKCPDGSYVSRDPCTCEFPPCPRCCDPATEPGEYENPSCFEGHACCPDGSWSCGSIGNGITFACGNELLVQDQDTFGKRCECRKDCTDDVKKCPDGTYLSRDPCTCEFPPCPSCCDLSTEPGMFGNPFCKEGHACCPDGSWTCSIGDAKTFSCGGELLVKGKDLFGQRCKCCDPDTKPLCFIGNARCCPRGEWSCPDGVSGDYKCGDLLLSPDDIFSKACACSKELKVCPDGSTVARDPSLDCAFAPCCCDPATEPGMFGNPLCFEGHACCPNGRWTCSIGDGKTFSCGDQDLVIGEDQDMFGERCECKEACTDDVKKCPDGTYVSRDPCTCEFPPCPRCCDPRTEPGEFGNPFCFEGHACCPDGSWTCSIGDAKTFACGGELLVKDQDTFGQRCKCCDPKEMPYCFVGTPRCCPQGKWSCPNGPDGDYKCGDLLLTPDDNFNRACTCTKDLKKCPDGSVVGRDPSLGCAFAPCCCDPATEPGVFGNPICFEGHACCPDGRWTCSSIGDGKTFACGDQNLVKGEDLFGERCECKEACPDDVKKCPDGAYVSRDPCTCEFPPCPRCCDPRTEPGAFGNPFCFDGHACCPDGTWTCSIGDGKSFYCDRELLVKGQDLFGQGCKCCQLELKPVAGSAACKFEPQCCPDGTWTCTSECSYDEPLDVDSVSVGEVCKCKEKCTDDVKICPDGSYVSRDPCTCEFPPCPRCCDPRTEPGAFGNPYCFEGHACCPDGKWACSIGDGSTFSCGGELLVRGQDLFGQGCKCCRLELKPVAGSSDCEFEPQCCPDGTWSCSRSADGKAYGCKTVDNPLIVGEDRFGEVCKCKEACTNDVKECPDGTFVSRDQCTCEFPPCPSCLAACTTDAYQCPGGSFVSRDRCNLCKFNDCPPSDAGVLAIAV